MKKNRKYKKIKIIMVFTTVLLIAFYCKCEAIGKCEEAFEYGVSRDMQTRDVRRFFSG